MVPPPNWDDQFDFEDEDIAPSKNKKDNKKSKPAVIDADDDFFDDDDHKKENTNKPQNTMQKQNNVKSNNKQKQKAYDEEEYQFEEQVLQENTEKQNNNNLKSNINQIQDQVDYQEDFDENPSSFNNKKEQKLKNQEEQYGDDFQDGYGEDFQQEEEEEKQLKKQETPKNNQINNLVIQTNDAKTPKFDPPKSSPRKQPLLPNNRHNDNKNKSKHKIVIPPKPPSSRKQNLSMNEPRKKQFSSKKKYQPPRSFSRKSISNKSKQKRPIQANNNNNYSRKKRKEKISSITANKYENQVNKIFPASDPYDMDPNKVTKINEKIRAMIKKYNDQLSEIINKNMYNLQSKKNQRTITKEEKVYMLEETKKNNQTVIDVMNREFEKLAGRQSELLQQQFQLQAYKKIEDAKEKMKDLIKTIKRLEYQINNEGKKLTEENSNKKLSNNLHQLKARLIQSKKQEERQQQKLVKLQEQYNSLNQKITDDEYQISQLIDKAREKGIKLENQNQLLRKFQAFKKKLEANRNHKMKLEHLLQGKVQIIAHEREQIRISLKNYDLQIKNIFQSIDHTHLDSLKLVDKVKKNPNSRQNYIIHLEQILGSFDLQQKQLQQPQDKQESVRSRVQSRKLKNKIIVESQKQDDNVNSYEQAYQEQGKMPKPKFIHKKIKQNQEEVQNSKQESVNQKSEQQEEKQTVVKEEDKKKPFSLKKNRIQTEQQQKEEEDVVEKKQQKKPQISEPNTENKQQSEKPSFAGPRMMKFKKKQVYQDNISKVQQTNTTKITQKSAEQTQNLNEKPKQAEEEKPIIPKRFNLRRNQDKNSQQNSYLPSVQTKNQSPRKQQPKKEQPQNKFKLDFNQIDDPYAKKKQTTTNVQNNQQRIVIPSLEVEEEKPKFNIRLKDRKKNQSNNQNNDYFSPNQEQKENKANNNPFTSNPLKQQNINNPYAQQATNAEPRKRQGPIKKAKNQILAQKKKINIYEQAEDLENLNEFAPQPKPSYTTNKQNQKQPNLNDILGLNKNKNNDDNFNDILTTNNARKKQKKKNDFFEDMDL